MGQNSVTQHDYLRHLKRIIHVTQVLMRNGVVQELSHLFNAPELKKLVTIKDKHSDSTTIVFRHNSSFLSYSLCQLLGLIVSAKYLYPEYLESWFILFYSENIFIG